VRPATRDNETLTASSSLQYASWTPARTCDLDCGMEKPACTTGAGSGWCTLVVVIVCYSGRVSKGARVKAVEVDDKVSIFQTPDVEREGVCLCLHLFG
jgi:hypothetical protein